MMKYIKFRQCDTINHTFLKSFFLLTIMTESSSTVIHLIILRVPVWVKWEGEGGQHNRNIIRHFKMYS